ncbi:uncharacterized protein LOC115691576 isoform X3 [Syzygium oleosum]|uniref:uncharacterized protein LOC115691576 isoform X3 n=1 Tax=Syzygium oleosum TaxID=219896 RepID=UPI0024BA5718|nr:uncharacterized protein LOC115691576 isoform X3 [Syzygium oleosum]
MGNCQAAETAAVAIHHPTGTKVERIHWSVSAHEIMSANPGHYVAHLIAASPQAAAAAKGESGSPSRQLRLLRPDDTLHIGQVYRLISFEDVLKEFAAKKCVKLGKLLERSGGVGVESKEKESTTSRGPSSKRDSASADNCVSTKRKQRVEIRDFPPHWIPEIRE